METKTLENDVWLCYRFLNACGKAFSLDVQCTEAGHLATNYAIHTCILLNCWKGVVVQISVTALLIDCTRLIRPISSQEWSFDKRCRKSAPHYYSLQNDEVLVQVQLLFLKGYDMSSPSDMFSLNDMILLK